MKKSNDLRVVKTKRAIKQAFLEMLKHKELNRITVTELAKIAEINKGTFYLHYSDIYELYDEVLTNSIQNTAFQNTYYAKMLSEPETFVRGFFTFSPESNDPNESVLFQPENLRYCDNFLSIMIQSIIQSIYDTGVLIDNHQNIMKLQSIIGGMFTCLIHVVSINNKKGLLISEGEINFFVDQIQHTFPESVDALYTK